MKINGLPDVQIGLAPTFLLDLRHGETAAHLMDAVRQWIDRMGYFKPGAPRIDGLWVQILPLEMGSPRAEANLRVGMTSLTQQFWLGDWNDDGVWRWVDEQHATDGVFSAEDDPCSLDYRPIRSTAAVS